MILRISYEIFIEETYFVCMSTIFLNLLLSTSVMSFWKFIFILKNTAMILISGFLFTSSTSTWTGISFARFKICYSYSYWSLYLYPIKIFIHNINIQHNHFYYIKQKFVEIIYYIYYTYHIYLLNLEKFYNIFRNWIYEWICKFFIHLGENYQ